jgi:hypothetical protein
LDNVVSARAQFLLFRRWLKWGSFERWQAREDATLKPLYRAGSRWQVGFDGADWWSGRVGCYPIGEEHVVEKKRW